MSMVAAVIGILTVATTVAILASVVGSCTVNSRLLASWENSKIHSGLLLILHFSSKISACPRSGSLPPSES